MMLGGFWREVSRNGGFEWFGQMAASGAASNGIDSTLSI
jgi:hypothetical protein